MKGNPARLGIAFSILLLVSLAAPSMRAQELRGKIQGVVSDGAGGVIPGADVTLRNVGTAVETSSQTNASGVYVFDFVLPGQYNLTVQSEGFRTFVQENIRVQTRADITVNAALEIGAVTESITVTEEPVAVKFNSTTMETTLDTKMTEELPMIHRHPLLMAMLDPQVVYTSGSSERSAYHHWAGSRMDVGGGTELKNEILIDGSSNTWGPKTNYVPPMDAVSELNVQQNPTDAEFGHTAGGVLSLQMKSGTNDWHGTAYYFGRNPNLNARADSFNNSPSVIRRNLWGITSGNPIIKNKLFSYVAYEGQDERAPSNLNRTLPSALERTGDFSRSLTAAGVLRPIYDPMTTTFVDNQVNRQQFANNVIPSTRFDPTSVRLMRDVWEPNRAGDNASGIFNYRNTFSVPFNYFNVMVREDWNVNDKLKVFGRWSRFKTLQTTPLITNSPAQGTGGSERNSNTYQGDAVWTINPTTVFNIRGSWNRPVDKFQDPDSEVPNYDDFWPGNGWYNSYAQELPQNYYPGYRVQVPGSDSSFGRRNYWFSAPYFWNLSSKLSMQKGKHYVKFGGEYRNYIGNTGFFQPFEFRFSPALTADTFINPNTRNSGDAWATMLLGALGDDSRIQTTPLYKGRVPFYGFFLHDDFKVSQRLTLNLGVRLEYDGGLKDARGRLSRELDLNDPIPEFQGAGAPMLPSSVTAIRGGQPSNTGAWRFTDGAGQAAYDPPLMLMPRIGAAYRLNNRTALRVGYGRFMIPTSVNIDGGINLNDSIPYAGFEQDSNPLPILEGRPQSFLNDPFPANRNPLVPIPGRARGRYTALGNTGQDRYFVENPKAAYNDRINFSLQQQVMAGIVLDFTYFISRGGNQHYQFQPNLLDPRFGFEHGALINQQVDNPYFNFGSPDTFPGGLRNRARVPINNLLRPHPYYGDLRAWQTAGRRIHYQAFQFKAQKPFRNGFTFLTGYNYNVRRNDEFYDDVDNVDQRFTMINDDNPRHKLNFSGVYEFPIGRGRKWGANWGKALDAAIGNWSTSFSYEYISGEFLRFGGLLENGDPRVETQTRERMFNPEAFSLLPAFTRRTNPWQYSGLTGPRFSNLDATLAKQFNITEKVMFELRMEAYNLTNSFMAGGIDRNVTSQRFGQINGQRPAFFGRQLQYGGRFRW